MRAWFRALFRSLSEWSRYEEHPRFTWAIVIFILLVSVTVVVIELITRALPNEVPLIR